MIERLSENAYCVRYTIKTESRKRIKILQNQRANVRCIDEKELLQWLIFLLLYLAYIIVLSSFYSIVYLLVWSHCNFDTFIHVISINRGINSTWRVVAAVIIIPAISPRLRTKNKELFYPWSFHMKDSTKEELPMLLEQPFRTALSLWYYWWHWLGCYHSYSSYPLL